MTRMRWARLGRDRRADRDRERLRSRGRCPRAVRRLSSFVSVDAMAVYRHLDIGTAKPTADERVAFAGTCSMWSIRTRSSPVEAFQASRAGDRGHRGAPNGALLVGGTGLYHRAIIDELEIPPRYPDIAEAARRAALDDRGSRANSTNSSSPLDPLGGESHRTGDERAASRPRARGDARDRSAVQFVRSRACRPTRPRRGIVLVRLELPASSSIGASRRASTRSSPRASSRRWRALLDRAGPLSRTAQQALGYRELIAHLKGECSLDEARTAHLAAHEALCPPSAGVVPPRSSHQSGSTRGCDDLVEAVTLQLAKRPGERAARGRLRPSVDVLRQLREVRGPRERLPRRLSTTSARSTFDAL